MKNKIKQFIKKYYLDIIILIGIWILSYNILRPASEKGFVLPSFSYTDYHTDKKVFGIMLIAIGINIAIRKYFIYKQNERKN